MVNESKKGDELGVDEIGERMEGGMEMVRWEKNLMKDVLGLE